MKLTFDYTDHVGAGFAASALQELAAETIKASRHGECVVDKSITLDVAIVDAAEIQRVNKLYRDKDAVTDVISIGEYSDERDICAAEERDIMLGEIVLCWSDIQNNATIQNTEDVYEFAYVFTHGILHLMSYKHSEEMFSLQDELSTAFCAKLKSESI